MKMASGNFLIGEQGLSLKGFADYIEPAFREVGCTVVDRLFTGSHGFDGNVLVSISGEDLEQKIRNGLLLATNRIGEEESKPGNFEKVTAHRFQVNENSYVVIGVYRENSTASELFPSIAQAYLLDRLEPKISKISGQIRSLINKKLSDF